MNRMINCRIIEQRIVKVGIVLTIVVAIFFLASCTSNEEDNNIANEDRQESIYDAEDADASSRKITPEQAMSMMEEDRQFVVLDVRTEAEFAGGHIEGAVLIPSAEIGSRAEAELPDKDVTILIYCRTGRRSADVARQLREMGYQDVYDFGGIYDWPFAIID